MDIKKNSLTIFFAIAWYTNLAQAAEAKLDADITFQYDSNVGLAESNRDIFSDEMVALNIIGSQTFMLNPYSNLSVKAKLARNQFVRFSDLSNTVLAIGARYRIQPEIGFYQPWLEFGMSAEKRHFDDSDIRDGVLLNLNLSAHKRLTESMNAHIGVDIEKRTADSGEVFDWERYSVFLGSQYKWSESSTFLASYRFQAGDQVFVATPSPAFREGANAIADDPVFGRRRAYRLDANAHTFNVGINYRINANNKLDAGLQYAKINAEASHEYNATQVHLSWLHRF